MATMAIIAGLGLAASAAGAGLSASSASKARKAQAKLAKTPFISGPDFAGQATESNLGQLPALEKLGAGVNLFNQQQLLAMQRQAIPGFDAMRQKGGENIMSMLRGELPPEVAQASFRTAAGKAIAGGFGGAPLGRNLQLRDLGLDRLKMMVQGITSAESWITNAAQTSVPQLYNISQMFLTPQQLYAGAIQQRGQNMGIAQQANMMPSGQSTIGGFLGNVGGTLAGAGAMGMLGGGSTGMAGNAYPSGGLLGSGSTVTNPSNFWGV